ERDRDCAVDESRGPQSRQGRWERGTGDCACCGGDRGCSARKWTAVLRGGGLQWADGGIGCGGSAADVWDFAEADDCADRGWAASGNRRGGRCRRRCAERRTGPAEAQTIARRRAGGNRGERNDSVCAGSPEVCAKTWRYYRGGHSEPQIARGAAGEDCDR